MGYLLAFVTVSSAYAPCCLNQPVHLSNYIHTAWDEQGKRTIRTLTQTYDNHLWLGTQDGMLNYNGMGFRPIAASADFRGDEQVNILLETKSGMLLAGTTRGLFVRQNDAFVRYSDVVGRVSSIITEKDDAFWFSTTTSGIYRCEANRCTRKLEGMVADGGVTVHALYLMNNALFVGTSDGLYKYELDTAKTTQYIPGTVVRVIKRQRSGAIFLGTNEGLFSYSDNEVTQAFPDLPETSVDIWAVYQKKSAVFLGTQRDGVIRVVDGEVETFPKEHVLATGKVYDLFEDREGSIWVGTEGNGLHRLRTGPFRAHYTGENNSVLGLYADNNYLYIGTEGKGIIVVGEQQEFKYDKSNGLGGNVVTSFSGSSSDSLWIGTLDGGLSILSEGKVRPFSGNAELGTDGVYSLYEDAQGHTWIGTDAGVFIYRNKQIEAHAGKPAKNITAFAENEKGMWVGTYDQGLFHYNNGAFTQILSAAEVNKDIILSLFQADNGELWIGTYEHGILKYDDGSLTSLSTEDGLPSNTAFQIIKDTAGDLWAGSNQGIYKLQQEQVAQYEAGLLAYIPTGIFNQASGIINPEVNGGFQPAGTLFKDHVFFPTINGVLYFNPEEVKAASYTVDVEIVEILVDGVPYTGNSIKIPSNTAQVEIKYNPVTFIGHNEILIRRSANPSVNPEWSKPSTERTFVLTDPPQNLYLELQAANLRGTWGNATRLTIEKTTPFYQTFGFWFALTLGIMFVGILVSVWRYKSIQSRQARLEQVVNERTAELKSAKTRIEKQAVALQQSLSEKEILLKEIHHRVRNNLQVISGLLYLQSNRIEDKQILNLFKQSEARIEAIAVVHEKLYATGNVEKISVDEYLKDLIKLIATSYQADERNIRLTVNSEPIIAKSDIATSIGLIVNELVSNVFKHAFDDATGMQNEIHVSFKKHDNHYFLQVSDNGKGIDDESSLANSSSLGIKIIQAFCDKLNATFTFESREGMVSTVTIPVEALIE